MRNASASSRKRPLSRIAARIFVSAGMAVFFVFGALTVGAAPPPVPAPFIPAIKIPTVKFTDIQTSSGGIDVPWIANYVGGVYEYAAGAAIVLAGVMVVIGGFQYQMAGGDSSRVSAAKQRIMDAIIGALLTIGAYVILSTINTELVKPQSIRVGVITGKKVERVPPPQMVAVTGEVARAPSKMLGLALEVAKALGGQNFACFVYASMKEESGGKQDALGHDENAATPIFSVGARRSFQNSGKFYSGATFPPVGCKDRTCQNQGPLNDDVKTMDATKPPDYGLDWRFSHGIGSGQSTIFPNSKPCEGKVAMGRGFRTGGKCYTLPELLDATKQTEAMVDHYKTCWGKGGKGADVAAAYVCYAGTIAKDNPIILKRIQHYNACLGSPPVPPK